MFKTKLNRDLPDADEVVTVAGEERLAVGGPGEGEALRRQAGGGARHLRPQLLHHVLALEVPDLDGRAGGGAEPVPGQG